MIVQIYAATNTSEALTMAALGVDHVGFIAGIYNEVNGELTFEQAREIAEALRGKAYSSALTMSTDIDEITHMVKEVHPDILHIASDTHAVDVKAMHLLRMQLPMHVRLMKAISIDDPNSIDVALQFAAVSDILLLDTKVQDLPGVGATGQTHDWNISRRVVREVNIPVILAGGLTPDNVQEAIAAVRPWGVDSNTGTNLPGEKVIKDMGQVRDFVDKAKPEETFGDDEPI